MKFKKFNKTVTLCTAISLLLGALCGCGNATSNSSSTPTTETVVDSSKSASAPNVVCTIFPEYDWVRNLDPDANVTMLLDNGVDLHSYQPTAEDLVKVANCDMFIYVGGESDGWVKDALANAVNKDMVVINLLDVLGDTVKEEEVKEGMQAEEEEEESSAEEEPEYDEHVWLSLKNSQTLCSYIADKLKTIDTDNVSAIDSNTKTYIGELSALDKQYTDTVNAASNKTILFGDRFPFRYMADDYGLDYYAAFVGCSAESEASFKTIKFLADKVDELGLHSVLTIEGKDHKIAETIIKNTKAKDQSILTLNSMQSVTSQDVRSGVTYLNIMETNLKVLKEALQ